MQSPKKNERFVEMSMIRERLKIEDEFAFSE